MAYGSQSYSAFGDELNLESIDNLRLVSTYDPATDAGVEATTYGSSQANIPFSLDVSTLFDANFTWDPLKYQLEVLVEPIMTAVGGTITCNGTGYDFDASIPKRVPSYSITGTTLSGTLTTYNLEADTRVGVRGNAFSTEASALPGISCNTLSTAAIYAYTYGKFHIYLTEV